LPPSEVFLGGSFYFHFEFSTKEECPFLRFENRMIARV
jgi:hypothetical protein